MNNEALTGDDPIGAQPPGRDMNEDLMILPKAELVPAAPAGAAPLPTDGLSLVEAHLAGIELVARPPAPEHRYVQKKDGTLYASGADIPEKEANAKLITWTPAQRAVDDWIDARNDLLCLVVRLIGTDRKAIGLLIDRARGLAGWSPAEVEAAWVDALASQALWQKAHERELIHKQLQKVLPPEHMRAVGDASIAHALAEARAVVAKLQVPEARRSRVEALRPKTLHEMRNLPPMRWRVKGLLP